MVSAVEVTVQAEGNAVGVLPVVGAREPDSLPLALKLLSPTLICGHAAGAKPTATHNTSHLRRCPPEFTSSVQSRGSPAP